MSETLRPGTTLELYPERRDVHRGWLDDTLASTLEWGPRRWQARTSRTQRFVARVDDYAATVREQTDTVLGEAARELGRQLRGRGLTDDLVAHAFALVREVATRTIGMRHFDVQLLGGWVMLHGMIAEMETGEGKTLTATLPACVAALTGIPVHIVTVNDYLATRDTEILRPLYAALGLRVGTITEEMDPPARRAAYACDVTYCTNKQVAFDYLRDRLVFGGDPSRLRLRLERLYQETPRSDRLLLRGLHFAIVDEADSVLVDEARTPLIISRSESDAEQDRLYHEALALAEALQPRRDFHVFDRERRIELTGSGQAALAQLARVRGGVWNGARTREELVRQALSAQQLFHRDTHYLVRDDTVQIIDEFTGRVMADRSWEHGLHQMIEAKEGCAITGQRETMARISYQRFFRRYLRLAGMTGTAREVARELWAVYRLYVVRVPTHRPLQRRIYPDQVYSTLHAKWNAVVARIRELHERGQPVLVGTRSVAASEHLSRLLDGAGLPHQVLNARQDREEAAIVARAGERGRITVATNMAGRGTDIRLAAGVADAGGLHVIATERHEARRIDRQLFGRCARQGDPGSAQAIVSVEDELAVTYCPTALRRVSAAMRGNGDSASAQLARLVLGMGQRIAERHHARIRHAMFKMDVQLGNVLAFAGRGE